jgi:5-methylcytosine-specific restriction endonuclease McrA
MSQYKCKKCGWAGKVNGRKRCLACYRKRVKEWREKNPEKRKLQKQRYDAKFRKERPEEYRSKRRKYYLPKTAARVYRIRKEWLLSGDVKKEDLKKIFLNHEGKCAYCGKKVIPRFSPKDPRGFDHVISRSKGGKHTASNIVVCCWKCNMLKR